MRMIDADELKAVYIPSEIEGFEKMMVPVEVVLQNIDDMPTVDAVPVKHGRWIPYNSKYGHDEKVYLCDQCNNNVGFTKMNFCPNCEKPVRNDDAYCHRCGQRLMFPKISFTDYVPGEKQDLIVRWEDESE